MIVLARTDRILVFPYLITINKYSYLPCLKEYNDSVPHEERGRE